MPTKKIVKIQVKKEYQIVAVVVFAIAAVYWGIKFLKGINVFSSKMVVYAAYSRLDNVIEANPVLVNGYKIGTINKISLIKRHGEYQILVKMLITEKVEIPKNSVAKVISTDLLGSKAIEIEYGNSKNIAQNNDTLLSEAEQGLKEVVDKRIAPLQAKIENLLGSVDSVAIAFNHILNRSARQNLVQSFENIKLALQNVVNTTHKLNEESDKISIIIQNLSKITITLEKTLPKITAHLAQLSDSLANAPIKNTVKDLDKTLIETKVMLANINEGKGTLGKLAKNDSLYNNLNKSLANLEKLLDDLKQHPKRYVHFSLFGKKEKVKN